MKPLLRILAGTTMALAVSIIEPTSSAHAISNGSFETPLVPAGNFTTFTSGSSAITGWTVVGPPGENVAIVSGTFTSTGFTFPAQDGVQWLDLTGAGSNAAAGVQQTVATTPGASFDLSFFVGNIFNPGGPLGTSSTVGLQVDGGPIGLFSNTSGAGSSSLVWQQFTFSFTATGATTSITFINADPSTDNSNGLDNVVLSLTPVPEPSMGILVGITGLLGLGSVLWRRSRRS